MENQADQKNENGKAPEGRKLSKDEQKRKELFEKVSSDYTDKGYGIENLTTSAIKANVFGTLTGFIVAQPFIAAYYLSKTWDGYEPSAAGFMLIFPVFLASIIVHELLHGTGWALFTKNKFKSIAFGVVWQALTPYCTCKEPLRKGQYIVGLILPCLILGFIPSVIACFTGNGLLLGFGALMIVCAGGDLMVLFMILKAKLKGDVLFLDHPTDIGLVAFVKDQGED